jgi:hypothetical protein
MKIIRITLLTSTAAILLLMGDAPPSSRFGVQLVPEAHAILGFWRRRARWAVAGAAVGTAAVAGSVAAANDYAAANANAAAANANAAAANANAAQASAPPPPPAASPGKPLPLGTVVHALPGGCTSTPVGGVEYYYCGGNFYRAVFQGNTLVYVTAKP